MYKTSVIIPVYNESATIERTLLEVIPYAASNPDTYFLFVNDGSKDNTVSIIKKKINGLANISLLDEKENRGKAGALKIGINNVDSEYVCFTDGDMAYSLNHISLLVNSLAANDIAIGNRKLGENHPQTAKRFIAGESFNFLVRKLLKLSYTDTQAGIKGFRKDAARKLFGLSLIKDFSFDAELLYIARLKGYKVGLIPARVNRSHMLNPSTIKVMRDSPKMMFSLIKIIFYRLTGRYNE